MELIDDNTPLPALDHMCNKVVVYQHEEPVAMEYKSMMSLRYIHEGRVNYCVGDKEISLKEREILLIEDGFKISSNINQPTKGITVFFPRNELNYLRQELLYRPLPLVESPLASLLSRIMELKDAIGYTEGELVRNILISMVFYVNQLGIYQGRLSYNRPNTKLDILTKLLKAKDIIEHKFSRPSSIDQLVEPLGISKFLFIRKFKEVFEITPVQYVLVKRIELAKKLLVESDDYVADIAEQCGFESLTHFSKAFKKYVGCSPLAFRNNFIEHLIVG